LPVQEEALLRLQTSRARRRLGWQPQLGMAEALRWTAQGYKRLHGAGDTSWLADQIARYHARLQDHDARPAEGELVDLMTHAVARTSQHEAA